MRTRKANMHEYLRIVVAAYIQCVMERRPVSRLPAQFSTFYQYKQAKH